MLNLNNEQWKTIPGFNNYECSNSGRVKNSKGKILKTFIQNAGYEAIDLTNNGYKKRFLVHRLIALTWIDNPNNKKYVNHIDGNKQNNSISNLEWVTNSENINHARSTGLNPYNSPTRGLKLKGQRQGTSKYIGVFWDKSRNKWKASVTYKNKLYKQKRFLTEIEAAQHYNNTVIELGLEKELPLNII